MGFYKLTLGSTDEKMTIGYTLSALPHSGHVWPKDDWSPLLAFTAQALENQISLSDEIVANLPTTVANMRPSTLILPDVIGAFGYPISAPPPLLSSRFRTLIDRLAPGSYQSVLAPRFWDVVKDEEIDASDYAFVNIVNSIDSWNKSKSEINKMVRKDGTVWHALGRHEVVNAQAVGDTNLWRDSVTNTVL
uniref:hypothetical protein n=1 Tax=Planktotalea sp. TaxID=2029877 RepID=UPI0025D95B65